MLILSFTFHYVSIKTQIEIRTPINVFHYLHSTMYLLKPKSLKLVVTFASLFTFHYVSIKTQQYHHQPQWLL